jgi:hypothetical protein
MKSLLIDNFLPYPKVVRKWALSQDFYDAEAFSRTIGSHTSWPGTRTHHVIDLDADYANSVLGTFSSIITNTYGRSNMGIRSYFQSCLETDGDSWIHQDNDVDVAAVLYLSPNAPISSGTSTYRCKDVPYWSSLDIQTMKQINSQERKDLHDSLFETIDTFGNVFNRIVIYPGNMFHKSNNYFGTSREMGRLTQVFFVKFES